MENLLFSRLITVFLTIFVFFSAQFVYALQIFSGIVVNEVNGQPIANAEVVLTNRFDKNSVKTMTNAQGEFQFSLYADMIYDLQVKSKGFLTKTTKDIVSNKNSNSINLTIALKFIIIGKSMRLENIDFLPNNEELHISDTKSIDDLYSLLFTNPNLIVEISSHTDSRGNDDYNYQLSQSRAEKIVNYLLSRGIKKTQMMARGYGETYLLNHCENDVKCAGRDHEENRRSEYMVIGFLNQDTN
ncbi:MAG: hypothetical protein EAZ97_14775 [Bacteroidetes bacterium]|nr:MAG: hypothetical protein EAZ97_14775 [Bacteroidota bacterium]